MKDQQPDRVRVESGPVIKAVIIVLAIVAAAILVWLLALGPYTRM